MASSRLTRIQWYDGRTVSGADMVDVQTAEYHRDVHSRKTVGATYLRQMFSLIWTIVGPGETPEPRMRLDSVDGFVNHLPIYSATDGPFDFDPTISNQLQADGMSGEIGSNDVTGAGQFKSVIIGLSYTERRYDTAQDINGANVDFRADDGICIKVISGVEESNSDPADPTLPADIIPIGKIIRSHNDDSDMIAGTKELQLIQSEYHVDSTLVSHITDHDRQAVPVAYCVNRAQTDQSDRYLPRLRMATGGIPGSFVIQDNLEFVIQGSIRRLTDIFTPLTDGSDTVYARIGPIFPGPQGTRTYLRARLDSYGTLQIYLLQGTEPGTGISYTENANAGPTPGGSSGGEISSNKFDVLLGVFIQGASPTAFTVGVYDSNPYYHQELSVSGNYATAQNTVPSAEQVAITRQSAHALEARWVPSVASNLNASHPTDREVFDSQTEVLAVKHGTVDIQRVGRYYDSSGSSVAIPSTNSYFQPAGKLIVSPKFVW